ncbi:unnamed protein product [Sphagnum jensenii]|uniref:Uncharacterized protein n=1 Tax=Sphagnum jensenii TaxID=128206 RepID=A0ABP0V701_9BRYO
MQFTVLRGLFATTLIAGTAIATPFPTSPEMPDLQPGTYVLRSMNVTAETAHPQPIQPCDVLTTITVSLDDLGNYDFSLLDDYAGDCGGAQQLPQTPRQYVLMRDTRVAFPCGVAYVSLQQVQSEGSSFPAFTFKDYQYAPQSCKDTDGSGRGGLTALYVANEWADSGMLEWGAYPDSN